MLLPKFASLVTELQSISPMPDDDTLSRLPEENHPLERLDALLAELEGITRSDFPLELISVLLNVYGIDDGYGVFQSISGLIESYPHLEEAYLLIRQGTENPHPGTRKWCCDLLSKRREKEDEPFLVARFQDENAAVRVEALNGILRLSQCYPMTHLISLIKSYIGDPDKKVASMAYCVWQSLQSSLPEHQREDLSFEELPVLDRMEAIRTQAFSDKAHMREILLSYAQDRFWEVREMIVRQLERWKDVQVVETLQKLLQDQSKEVRIEAVRSLHVIGVSSTIDPLIACLQDTEWNVRKRAVLALKRWDDPKIVKALQRCVHDPDERVRLTVMEALREIEAKQAGR